GDAARPWVGRGVVVGPAEREQGDETRSRHQPGDDNGPPAPAVAGVSGGLRRGRGPGCGARGARVLAEDARVRLRPGTAPSPSWGPGPGSMARSSAYRRRASR